jgi:hypothetical protein
LSRDSISGPQTPTPLSGWNHYPNLRNRPHAPAAGRGRLQRQIARCFVVFGPEVTSSRLYDWCYMRRARHPHSVWRIVRTIADQIGRTPTIGRPWIWRIKTPGADSLSATKD